MTDSSIKPSATLLLDALTDYTKQYQEGLITEAEWCNSCITKLLNHHRQMQEYTADQLTQWNASFKQFPGVLTDA